MLYIKYDRVLQREQRDVCTSFTPNNIFNSQTICKSKIED